MAKNQIPPKQALLWCENLVFDDESEMYGIIERWLNSRSNRACSRTMTEFNYDYADTNRFADVMGLYRQNGFPYFVGVEAKLSRRDLGKAVRQARRLQSFCHEVYVAIPKGQFQEMTKDAQEDYLNLLFMNRVGLLLVKKRGLPDVLLKVRPSMFRLDRHNRAVEYFREYTEGDKKEFAGGVLDDELCEMLLHDFKETDVFGNYSFLNEEWWYGYDADSTWIWSDLGGITVEHNRLLFEAKVEDPNAAALVFLEAPDRISKIIGKRLKKLNAPVDWSKRGLAKSPRLTAYYARRGLWFPTRSREFLSISIDLGLLVNSAIALQMGEFLNERSVHKMFLEAELSRNILVAGGGITGTRHYAEDLRDMFDVLYNIGKDLKSNTG